MLKEEHPDTENQTPNVVINTPNRPPPPRSSYYSKQSTPHTPAAPPKPGTPGRADLTPRARSSYPIMTPNRGFSRGTPRSSTRDPASVPQTPERNKYQTPVRKSMPIFRDPIHQPRDKSGASSFGENQNDLLKTPEPKKRSNPDEVGSSKRPKTSVSTPPSTSSRKPVISPKEQGSSCLRYCFNVH